MINKKNEQGNIQPIVCMHHGISSIIAIDDQSLACDPQILNFRKEVVEEPNIILDRLKNFATTLSKVKQCESFLNVQYLKYHSTGQNKF